MDRLICENPQHTAAVQHDEDNLAHDRSAQLQFSLMRDEGWGEGQNRLHKQTAVTPLQ